MLVVSKRSNTFKPKKFYITLLMKKKKKTIMALNTGALSIEMSSIDSLLIESLAASVKAKG